MAVTRPSYEHGAADTALLYMTIGECQHRTAEAYPEKEALISLHQGGQVTYAEFDRLTDQLAKGILSLGVK